MSSRVEKRRQRRNSRRKDKSSGSFLKYWSISQVEDAARPCPNESFLWVLQCQTRYDRRNVGCRYPRVLEVVVPDRVWERMEGTYKKKDTWETYKRSSRKGIQMNCSTIVRVKSAIASSKIAILGSKRHTWEQIFSSQRPCLLMLCHPDLRSWSTI